MGLAVAALVGVQLLYLPAFRWASGRWAALAGLRARIAEASGLAADRPRLQQVMQQQQALQKRLYESQSPARALELLTQQARAQHVVLQGTQSSAGPAQRAVLQVTATGSYRALGEWLGWLSSEAPFLSALTAVTITKAPSGGSDRRAVVTLEVPPTLSGEAPTAARALQRQRTTTLTWDRDPFVPPSPPARRPAAGGVVVSGILWSPEHPLAVVNGVVVGVGKTVGGHYIRKITQDRVVVSDGETTTELTVTP